MSRPRCTLSLHGLHAIHGGDLRHVIDVAVQADEIGIDALSLPDHVAMGTRTDRYPYGKFPLPEDFPWFEPLTVLAAVAGATKRIRLTTSVLISPLRPAALLAKICATLDQLSGGRLELGVGSGWQREEYEAVGVPFAKRAQRMVDGLRACRALWSGERVSFDSATVSYQEILSLPSPVQSAGIPLWLGLAPTPRVRQWMAELNAGWVAMAVAPEELAGDVSAIRDTFSERGRAVEDVRVRAGLPIRLGENGRPDLRLTLEGIDAALAVGVTDIEIFLSAFVALPEQLPEVLREIAARMRRVD